MAIGRKIKLCLNSNITTPKFIEALSKDHKILTVQQLIPNNPSPSDDEIIKKANSEDFHIITRNTKHFKGLFRYQNIQIGVIGINVEHNKIYTQLDCLLTKKIVSHENLHNKFYEIDLEGFVVYDKNGEIIMPKISWAKLCH